MAATSQDRVVVWQQLKQLQDVSQETWILQTSLAKPGEDLVG